MISVMACIATYGLFAWASVRVFVTNDAASSKTKRLVGVFGSLAAIYFISLSALSDAPQWRKVLAVGLFFGAIALFLWAISQFSSDEIGFAGSGRPPEKLVTTGPYQLIRHPIYVAYVLGWLGGAAASMTLFQALVSFLFVTIMGAIYVRSALLEERALLTSELANEYGNYLNATKRFVPLLV